MIAVVVNRSKGTVLPERAQGLSELFSTPHVMALPFDAQNGDLTDIFKQIRGYQ